MLQTILALCIVSAPHGVCQAEKDFLEGKPSWATEEWIDFASHIVAGEIPQECAECALVTACTIRRDVERGWNPWNLRTRWYGWKSPTKLSQNAIEQALLPMGCLGVPNCKYLGNNNDYNNHWRPSPAVHFGNDNGKSICVLWESDKNESESTTNKQDSQLLHAIERGVLYAEEELDATFTK